MEKNYITEPQIESVVIQRFSTHERIYSNKNNNKSEFNWKNSECLHTERQPNGFVFNVSFVIE